ncbi:MAG: glycyl-radical enzyme activating protein [Clostridia bacterium]|nr:glycyl-radical enzyme activating protein [Clostridia bacterium]
MQKGLVFNIQRFSLHDGPGIRTGVFLKGCPLRCRWCHNPEGFTMAAELEYNPVKCIGCGRCTVCPEGCHRIADGAHLFDRTGCVKCFRCVDACPAGALLRAGREYTVDEVMETVEKDRPYYENSGGGLTVSGGEPLLQWEFTLALLKEARARGIDTAIETSGFAPSEVIKAISSYVDVFLFDYKVTDPGDHEKYTGVPRAPILENLRLLNEEGRRVVLRCPIIPGVNDDDGHFDAIAELSRELDSVFRVDLEPYHELGTAKYPKFGKEASFSAEPPAKERMEEIKRYVQDRTPKRVTIS